MTQEIELELTFLAKELPKDIKTVKPTRIIDIYIPDTPKHSHLRLRQKGDKYEMTKKCQLQKEMHLNRLSKQYRLQKMSLLPYLVVAKNE